MSTELKEQPAQTKQLTIKQHLMSDGLKAQIVAASRQLIVREAGDGHAIEFAGNRRDGDATYAGVEFDGPQSPEIEAVLAEHSDRVTDI